MKINFIPTTIICLLLVLAIVSCKSKEENVDEAFEIVKQEKMLNDTTDVSEETFQELNKGTAVKKSETTSEWLRFKNEMERKILANENKINKIKSNIGPNSKLKRSLSELEEENNNLKKELNDYQEDERVRWENFKTTITHEMKEVEFKLTDLRIKK